MKIIFYKLSILAFFLSPIFCLFLLTLAEFSAWRQYGYPVSLKRQNKNFCVCVCVGHIINNKKALSALHASSLRYPCSKNLTKQHWLTSHSRPIYPPPTLPNCATWAPRFVPKHVKCRFQNTLAKKSTLQYTW